MLLLFVAPDPVKAERYEDGVLRARERMQMMQDEKAAEHQQETEEVGKTWPEMRWV